MVIRLIFLTHRTPYIKASVSLFNMQTVGFSSQQQMLFTDCYLNKKPQHLGRFDIVYLDRKDGANTLDESESTIVHVIWQIP